MNVRYRVELSQTERAELTALLSRGKHPARKLKRAQILLAVDAALATMRSPGAWALAARPCIAQAALRARQSSGGDQRIAARRKPQAHRQRGGAPGATACSKPPQGRARWTLELLAGELVRLTEHASLSRETVRRRLAENDLKPWRKDMWCIPQVDAEYVARMEDVLDLYAEALDLKHLVVCFDESSTQLIGEVRELIWARSGQIERYDCEYRRNGTANLFVFLDVHRLWRKIKVTDSRTAIDFATGMCVVTYVDFPAAERILSSWTI